MKIKKSYLTIALALSICGVLFQNCAAAPPPDIGQLKSSSNSVGAFTCSFAGQILTEGQSTTAYQALSVAAGGSCVSQTRTCSSGVLSGSYQFGSCSVQSPSATASCSLYGQTVPHGGSIQAFQSSSVSSGSCVSQSRVCSNGTLSGTYQYLSCVRNCSFNGAEVGHGSSVQAFAASSVPNGSTCVSQQRQCSDGTLSGSYAYSSCSVQPAAPSGTASCEFDGRLVLHGDSVTAYSTDIAPYGTTCLAYDELRTCNNGNLSGSFRFSFCTREVDNCTGYNNTGYRQLDVVCP